MAHLIETAAGLGLVDDDAPELSPLVLDLTHARKLGKGDDLLRALGKDKGVRAIVDATAGLGRDALALAHAGFEVTAVERAPLLQALWTDALRRHAPDRVRFVCADAFSFLPTLVDDPALRPDAILLDPMYPHGPRKALQQREMRLLRAAVGEDGDAAALLALARSVARLRVVVKRPKKAPALAAGVAHSWVGASTRFDLYLS